MTGPSAGAAFLKFVMEDIMGLELPTEPTSDDKKDSDKESKQDTESTPKGE